MNTVVNVCIIIVTISIFSLVIMLIMVLIDVRRMRIKSESFLDKIEGELNPITSEITQIAEDIRQITHTARCQIEKVDSTADFINKNVNNVFERWITTLNTLHDAIAEPVGDIVVFLKGFSRGIKFFFGNGRDINNSK
ncbi:MAG: hypothetical protein AMJ42_01395 [Deltaproteobacteria bacterium DG_8]|nr:MAG: hypothetical protein AMJ42_01395 [Deltaproteobacteria bacterium DG_8]